MASILDSLHLTSRFIGASTISLKKYLEQIAKLDEKIKDAQQEVLLLEILKLQTGYYK